MNRGARSSVSAPSTIRLQSSAATLAERTFSHGTRASAHRRRIPISTRDISRLNMATGTPDSTATLRATLVTNEDLPIPGRAATTIRFPGWSPWRRPSRSEKPVGSPTNGVSRW
jgi:hypothetical protein